MADRRVSLAVDVLHMGDRPFEDLKAPGSISVLLRRSARLVEGGDNFLDEL